VNRLRSWRAPALVAVLAAALAVGFLARSPRLFHQAHPIAPTHGIITNAYVESGYDFRRRFTLSWFLTSNQVIAGFQRSSNGVVQLIRFDPDQAGAPSVETPAALAQIEGQPLIFWAASPDGQWLLTVRRLQPMMRLYQVYRADHTLHARWTNPYEGRSQPDWLLNSQGFVEWPIRESRLLARVYWLDTAESTEVDLAALPVHTLRTPDSLPQPCVPMLYSPESSEIAAEFLILSPDRQPRNWQRATLILPESLRHYEKITVSLSPAAHQLAWLCETTDYLPHLSLNAVPPFIHSELQLRTSLFLSRPDGSQLSFLGRTRSGTTVPAVRWSPKSDQLTFVYQSALWTQRLPPPTPP
jgi:hypothetical protein